MKSREISRSKIGPFSLACTDPYIGIGESTNLWDNILYLCPINSSKLHIEVYFMLATHQIVTTVLLSLHRTDISLYRVENW